MKISELRKLLIPRISKNLSLVFMGNAFSAGLGFFILLLISKTLTVGDFGVFTIVTSIMLMVQPIASFGMNTTVIKFISSRLGRGEKKEAYLIFKTSLLGIIFFSSGTAGILLLAAGVLSQTFLRHADASSLLRTAAAGIITLALFYFIKAVFCAFQKFKGLVSLQIAMDVLKLILIGGLVLVSALTPLSAVLVFIGVSFVGACVGLYLFRYVMRTKIQNIFRTFFSLLSYSIWVFLGSVFGVTFQYVGLLLLAGIKGTEEAGIYGLALTLSFVFPVLIMTFRSVLLPETSQFTEKRQFENYIKNTLKIFLSSGFLVIPFLLLSTWLIPLIFGQNYADSISIFNWLMVGFVPDAVIKCLNQALYALDQPKVVAFFDMGRLSFMVVGSILLIPSLGARAPAVAALISNSLTLLLTGRYSWSVRSKSKLF